MVNDPPNTPIVVTTEHAEPTTMDASTQTFHGTALESISEIDHEAFLEIAIAFLTHPMDYGRMLRLIGFTPILSPGLPLEFGGFEINLIPVVYRTIKRIWESDGIVGCYRGLAARVLGIYAYKHLTPLILEHTKLDKMFPEINDPPNITEEGEPIENDYFKLTRRGIILCIVSGVVLQPFNVVSLRMMAYYINKVDQYKSLFNAVASVYVENGVFGYFRGLFAKLLRDVLFVVFSNTIAFHINKYVFKTKPARMLTVPFSSVLASYILNPLSVASICMTVTGSSLNVGVNSNNTWNTCWRLLYTDQPSGVPPIGIPLASPSHAFVGYMLLRSRHKPQQTRDDTKPVITGIRQKFI